MGSYLGGFHFLDPLGGLGKIVELARRWRNQVAKAEPIRFLLACLGIRDPGRGPVEQHGRGALLRWYLSLGSARKPEATRALLAVVGGAMHGQARVAQQIARQLQETESHYQHPVTTALLESWAQTSDVGIIAQFLRNWHSKLVGKLITPII